LSASRSRNEVVLFRYYARNCISRKFGMIGRAEGGGTNGPSSRLTGQLASMRRFV
jgi:hypothetical protein